MRGCDNQPLSHRKSAISTRPIRAIAIQKGVNSLELVMEQSAFNQERLNGLLCSNFPNCSMRQAWHQAVWDKCCRCHG